jgi:hypothetical protein
LTSRRADTGQAGLHGVIGEDGVPRPLVYGRRQIRRARWKVMPALALAYEVVLVDRRGCIWQRWLWARRCSPVAAAAEIRR